MFTLKTQKHTAYLLAPHVKTQIESTTPLDQFKHINSLKKETEKPLSDNSDIMFQYVPICSASFPHSYHISSGYLT